MRTTIKLDPATRERLKRFGRKGETYDEVLQKLMNRCDKKTEV